MKRTELCGLMLVTLAVVICLSLGTSGPALATSEWSQVGATCVPDPTTTPAQYITSTSGAVGFKGVTTGSLLFRCNVTNPLDTAYNPSWNTLFLTFSDTNTFGYVKATLYKKSKSTGAYSVVGTVTSTDGSGVRKIGNTLTSSFDFYNYAYYIRVILYRSSTGNAPSFHIVSLGYVEP